MKPPTSHRTRRAAMTIIELMVMITVVAITGAIMFNILYTGMILFAKNSAIDVAHQEARVAVLQMEQDIHAAVSIPELVDTSRPANVISGTGPAPGISFQLFSAGPFQVTPSSTGYPATQNAISINTYEQYNYPTGYTPVGGQRLIIPTHQIELDIGTNPGDVVMSGTTATVKLYQNNVACNLPQAVTTTETVGGVTSTNLNIPCFITDRVSYVVIGSQLWYYGRQSTGVAPKLMASDLTSATPFSIPATALGAPFNRFVAAINLVTSDTAYGNLHFRAANMFLNAMEPYRARLCTYQ